MVTRIRQLLEQKQLTPTQFADAIGVGRPVMSHILSERNKPSLEVVQRIIEAFPEVSMPWLLKGAGEMLESGAKPQPAGFTSASPASDEAPASVAPASVLSAEPPVIAATLPAEASSSAVEAPVDPDAVSLTNEKEAEATPPAFAGSTTAPAPKPAANMVGKAIRVFPPLAASTPAPVASELPSAPMIPVPAAPRPFTAPRFVRPSTPLPAVAQAPAAPLPVVAPASVATPLPLQVAATPVAPAVPPAPSVLASAPVDAALLPFLNDSGKAIRRIVIFYRDGSFADYQPEQ